MLSLLMLLLAIMTAVMATGGNKQSAQTTLYLYAREYVSIWTRSLYAPDIGQ